MLTGLGRPQVKRLIWLALIGVALGLGIALWRVGLETLPPQSNEQVLTKGVAEGRRQRYASWEFTYDSATTRADQITQEIDGIHDGVYYRDGKPVVHMRAQRVIMNSATHDFTVDGPVHFDVDDKGKVRTVDTVSAMWSQSAQLLTLPGKVTVGSEGGATLVLSGLSANLQTGQYRLGKVNGGYTP
ncbi:MAG: hypothetical protein JO101_00100 [Candidatus Eremiobacteraeota bacterium]|nr:hypothetical protein [Candidatus Eremiobacteraeota bacterium]MBV8353693.1 hypothetical protein [Candidatus Eremiobacteraeota bacterium]